MYTGLMSRGRAKEQITGIFFRGWSVSRFDQLAKDFSQKRLTQMVRPLALKRIREHQSLGHRIVVVTASPDRLIRQWTSLMRIELIATELEINEDMLSGRFHTPNCASEEKVRRIMSYLELEAYETIYAYGNSASDRPMMTLAHHSEYQPFRKPDGYTTLT